MAFVILNRARLPGIDGWTLRMLRLLLSPRFDFAGGTPERVAFVASRLIMGARDLATTDMPCSTIKLHMAGAVDRQFFIAIGSGLVGAGLFTASDVGGNWLHLKL